MTKHWYRVLILEDGASINDVYKQYNALKFSFDDDFQLQVQRAYSILGNESSKFNSDTKIIIFT